MNFTRYFCLFARPLSLWLCLLQLAAGLLAPGSAWAGCANNTPGGPGQPPCGGECPCEASNGGKGGMDSFSAYTGNEHRQITDLVVWGAVGETPLAWRRFANSRYVPGPQWMGNAHNWRHSFQWELSVFRDASPAPASVDLTYPSGTLNHWVRGAAPTAGTPTPYYSTGAVTDTFALSADAATFTLTRRDGSQFLFTAYTSGSTTAYRLTRILDPYQNALVLSYVGARLDKVTEPGGRFLRVFYQSLPFKLDKSTSLAKITNAPPANQYSELEVTTATPFRFLRYTHPTGNARCQVAEVEFYGENLETPGGPPVKLTGTPIGGSTGTGDADFNKALDGNPATAFTSTLINGDYVGLDLGANNARRIVKVRFYPKANEAARMDEGSFLGSNEQPGNLTVIAKVETGDNVKTGFLKRSVQYDYAAFADPGLPFVFQTLTAARYGDNTRADYTYAQNYPGTRPALVTAVDPRVDGRLTHARFEYLTANANYSGFISKEINGKTGGVIATLSHTSGNAVANILYANGARKVLNVDVASGQVTRETNALNHVTKHTYEQGGQGFPDSATDARNHTTSYTNTNRGNWLTVIHPDGAVETWTRDSLDLPLTYRLEGPGLPAPRLTTYTRDPQHRPTRLDHPDGSHEAWTYNSFGQVLTHRLQNGGTESYAYDARGLKTSATDAENHVTTFGYDTADRLVSVTDPLGHTTAYQYDERGQRTRTTFADNKFVIFGYDAFGNYTSHTNELGKTWTSTFDEFKRLLTSTDPLNRTTTYGYELAGASGGTCASCDGKNTPTSITLPSGKTTVIAYDLEWRRTSVTVGAGTAEAATTTYGYDAAGNLVTTTDPRGKVWTYAYDGRNRRLSVTDPLNHKTEWTYDAAGNRLTEKWADNTMTTYVYDAMNQVTRATDPLNQVTQGSYDLAGNLKSLTDARGNVHEFAYDLHGRKTRLTYPGGSFEAWSYDAAGRLATYTTRAGQTKTCTPDARGRDTLCDWSDDTPDVSTTYDAVGRVLTMNNINSALTYTYDDAGQLLSETQNINGGPGQKTVSYTYNADGQRATLSYPGGTVAYTYTARNQLKEVTADSPPPLATYTYDLAGNRTVKTLENGTTATFAYDNASRLTSLTHRRGGTAFASFAYALNAVGNRTSVTREDGKGDVYAYDLNDQLTGVQYEASTPAGSPSAPTKTQGFVYDAVGNRTSVTDNGAVTAYEAANVLNQYLSVGTSVLAYDVNGNLVGTDGAINYGYDAQNRLINTQIGTNAVVIAYDAHNRPVKRTINGTAMFLVYDGWRLVAEFEGAVQSARYVHGARTDELLVRVTPAGTLYYHHDNLGSTVALTNAVGVTLESYRYDAFGQVTKVRDATGGVLAASAFANRFLFTGREWISEAEIYDFRNRVYATGLGRFLQTDPIGYDGEDINLYRYVLNDPIKFTDRFGLKKCCPKELDEARIAYNNCMETAKNKYESNVHRHHASVLKKIEDWENSFQTYVKELLDALNKEVMENCAKKEDIGERLDCQYSAEITFNILHDKAEGAKDKWINTAKAGFVAFLKGAKSKLNLDQRYCGHAAKMKCSNF